MFQRVSPKLDFPAEEREVTELWKANRIFEKTVEQARGKPRFVFYEGPPTANGMPHNGHVLTRVIKDLFPRYKTMRGFEVPRKAGWDTHGLPVEVEVEKELRIHGKAAIEAYGVEPFIAKCIDSVFRYQSEWEKMTERIAFWVDLEDAYVTYHKAYVESVWWALSELFKKGLLYKGHKVVWWWAQGGTALSAAEVGGSYRTVDDPSVYVAFPLKEDPSTSLLVWTTTPWTLPSNMYAAVKADLDYVVVEHDGKKLIVAEALREPLAKKLKKDLPVTATMKGAALVGKDYSPPFSHYEARAKNGAWKVLAADFVTLDTGTGIVHIAPAFGEDDYKAHRVEVSRGHWPETEPPVCAIGPDGLFDGDFGEGVTGMWVKDADKPLTAKLAERGVLVHAESYRHDYPFCPRAENDPLIQFARPAWYIKTTQEITHAIANSNTVNWIPAHIREGRMGDFLANNVDWALSRERWWGTPLNIWINDATGKMEAPSSVADIVLKNPRAFDHFHEAKKKNPSLSEHLIVHKPWIDSVTWHNPGEEGTYRRVPEVIDCWFDSGCMPFAQFGFPHSGAETFQKNFPATFISEAIDQTRGWFYSLLMISTLVFDKQTQEKFGLTSKGAHPYETCVVLGHVCDKDGKKESKSKGNYTPPDIVLDEVKLEFAVVSPADAAQHYKAKPGKGAYISPDDYDGLDLARPKAKINLRTSRKEVACELEPLKGVPRRVIVLSEELMSSLALKPTSKIDVKVTEVARLPDDERVTVCDPESPAPGADAFRWFFCASSPPSSNTRHSLSNVRSLQKEFLVKLRNTYGFFTIYAGIDKYDPQRKGEAKLSELDRWIKSELAMTIAKVTEHMDAYDVYPATQRLIDFTESLSNWYVRRSRERFWRAGWDKDKRAAYDTLYECLVALTKMIAPFVPYTAERMYQNLVVGHSAEAKESVHLVSWPSAEEGNVDRALSEKMRVVRDIVSLGLQVRTSAKIKVRQPLRTAHVIAAGVHAIQSAKDVMAEELNVLDVDFVPPERAGEFVEYVLKPNFRTLGPRGLGEQAQKLKVSMAKLSGADTLRVMNEILTAGIARVDGIELGRDDVEVAFKTKEGFAAAGDRVGVVVLETALDDDLRDRGFMRELVSRVQQARKDMGLEFTDRIALALHGKGDRLRRVVQRFENEIAHEVLAGSVAIHEDSRDGAIEIDGEHVTVVVTRV